MKLSAFHLSFLFHVRGFSLEHREYLVYLIYRNPVSSLYTLGMPDYEFQEKTKQEYVKYN